MNYSVIYCLSNKYTIYNISKWLIFKKKQPTEIKINCLDIKTTRDILSFMY